MAVLITSWSCDPNIQQLAIDALPFLLSTIIIMNTNTTISTNNNNNMNTTGLNPTANGLLQAISGGGLSALEVVAASGDAFLPLKAAVVEALAVIGIIKVCVLTAIIPSRLSMLLLQQFKINKKDWAALSGTLIQKVEEIVQATCQYNESHVPSALQSNLENLKGCVVLIVSLWICPKLESCTSILDHLKEDVIKIQQQNTWKRFANFRKDQEHIADFQVKLNALVSMHYIIDHLIHLIIQPNFQDHLSVEESSQASKSSYKYLTWYYFLTCIDVKRDVWEGPVMTGPNKDDMFIERGNVSERPTTTENSMYKLAF
jgi:hypothetical protein